MYIAFTKDGSYLEMCFVPSVSSVVIYLRCRIEILSEISEHAFVPT